MSRVRSGVDAEVEWRLREITDDYQRNPVFEIHAPTIIWLDRLIDSFADGMVSSVGLLIASIVTMVWVAIEPALEFNDNWWFIIGTFTGLVRFINGLVLGNFYDRNENVAEMKLEKIAESDDR